jgi:hypothetical protein
VNLEERSNVDGRKTAVRSDILKISKYLIYPIPRARTELAGVPALERVSGLCDVVQASGLL